MRRSAVAAAVIAVGLLGTGAAMRLARPGDVDALAAAALAAAPARGAPGLIVVADPACPACEGALEELREVVRPRDLGLDVRILGREGEGRALLEAAGPGLIPVFLVVDAAGSPVAMIRGPRPPALLRAWLEEAVARALANPLDRGAARGPP